MSESLFSETPVRLGFGSNLWCRYYRTRTEPCRSIFGIGIVPEKAARHWKRSMQMDFARLSDDWATRQLSVAVRNEAELTPAALSLFDHLVL